MAMLCLKIQQDDFPPRGGQKGVYNGAQKSLQEETKIFHDKAS